MSDSYNVMYYDESYMEEPRLVETFDDDHKDNEQAAYWYIGHRYYPHYHYMKKVVVE